jgi:nucleotide-binding universal stress UspA family protein
MGEPDAPTIGSPLLVPFDGSGHAEAVFPYLPLLADGERKVILLQVVPEARAVRSPLGDVMLTADEIQAAWETAARVDLDRAASRLQALAPDLQIDRVVAFGDPADQISEVARRSQARGILLSTQGVSATGPRSFGSVVARVVRLAPVPVMLVQPGAAPDGDDVIGRFVIAHDGSERASRVFPLVDDLARRLGAPVRVVSVVEDERSAIPAPVAALIDPHLRDEALADALNAARREIEVLGAQLLRRGLPASWEVLSGPAAPAIINACAPRDVLVITSHGKSTSRWMLGSVAEKLVRESPVPVILLRTPPQPETERSS